jgi:hypothetical protein
VTTVDVLPDIVLMARTWLAGYSAIDDLVDERIATRSHGVLPEIVLQRIGGRPVERRRLDVGRLQVDSFAATEQLASLIARTARAALLEMEGQFVLDEDDDRLGFVTAVNDDLALSWAPDTIRTPPTPRFIFGVAVYAHAA